MRITKMICTQATLPQVQLTTKKESTIKQKQQNQKQTKKSLRACWKEIDGRLVCQWTMS